MVTVFTQYLRNCCFVKDSQVLKICIDDILKVSTEFSPVTHEIKMTW